MNDAVAEEWYEDNTVEINGDAYWKAMSEEDFVITIQAMGWKDAAEFTAETGVEYSDIEGQRWMLCGHPARVFTA